MPANAGDKLTNGAHFVDMGEEPVAANDLGYMTSIAWSPELKTYVGLGFLKAGRSRKGETVRAVDFMRKNHIDVKIVSPHFVDPDGERLRG